MPRILLAGSDSRLLATRAAVLSKTGAAVLYHDPTQALKILDREAFDLVVLCHSLLEGDVALIVAKVHQKTPHTKILMVTSELERYETRINSNVDATSIPEPGHLVARAKELLQGTSHVSPAKGRDDLSPVHLIAD
jgi:DNA-binding response OmpR family regulator